MWRTPWAGSGRRKKKQHGGKLDRRWTDRILGWTQPPATAETSFEQTLHCTSVCGQLAVKQLLSGLDEQGGAAELKIEKNPIPRDNQNRKSVLSIVAVQTR